MVFRLSSVVSNVSSIQFKLDEKRVDNQISIIVGPNGVGKTRLLSTLADRFRGRKNYTRSKDVSVDFSIETAPWSLADPTRVVAQTFSPFSRFPADRRQLLRFKDYLDDGQERYVAIGFTRSMGFRGSVSKDAVGRIVRKLVTRPDQAQPLSVALRGLGFYDRLELWYVATPGGHNLDMSSLNRSQSEWKKEVSQFIDSIEKRDRVYSEQMRVKRELSNGARVRDAVVNEIAEALLLVSSLENNAVAQSSSASKTRFKMELFLGDGLSDSVQKLLRAIVVLNRFGILRLQDCYFYPDGSRNGWARDLFSGGGFQSRAFDITEASSGEQQLLSSLFGLVSEAEDDCLILMDEPELSLHPVWQTQLLDLLQQALRGFKGCHIVIATHSALLAQRARELNLDVCGVGARNLSVFDEFSSGPPSVDQTLLETFGLAVRDSVYVSRLLLSLVLDAERSPEKSLVAKKKLDALRVMYKTAAIEDLHVSKLIDDAFQLIDFEGGVGVEDDS